MTIGDVEWTHPLPILKLVVKEDPILGTWDTSRICHKMLAQLIKISPKEA